MDDARLELILQKGKFFDELPPISDALEQKILRTPYQASLVWPKIGATCWQKIQNYQASPTGDGRKTVPILFQCLYGPPQLLFLEHYWRSWLCVAVDMQRVSVLLQRHKCAFLCGHRSLCMHTVLPTGIRIHNSLNSTNCFHYCHPDIVFCNIHFSYFKH